MSRAACMSLIALTAALWNFTVGRDISANMFIAAFLCIQGCRRSQPDENSRQWAHIALACTILCVAICLYALYGLAEGLQWKRPASW